MTLTDPRGVAHSGSEAAALDLYEQALLSLAGFHGDPMGLADAALATDPTLAAAHLIKAHMLAFAMEPGFTAAAEASLAAAELLPMNPREQTHVAAVRAWLLGEYDTALERLDGVLAEQPRDLLALMIAHQGDFFTGRTGALLERPAHALRHWSDDLPGHSSVLGMQAFGLEENGAFAEAEAVGRMAVAQDSKDAFAIHAVAHVLEMQGRDAEGIHWYTEREADWAEDSFFATHNAWHLALYHADLDDRAAALAVWERRIRPNEQSIVLNLSDAASLLWRLGLAGVEAEHRWQDVAGRFAGHAGDGHYVFNDVHAMLAFAAAGRDDLATALLAAQARQARGTSSAAAMTRAAGLPIGRALWAFGQEDYAAAVDGLLACRAAWPRMGGSHAQREIVELTLVEAAIRDRRFSLARDLLERRLARKPESRRAALDLARCRG